MQRGTIKNFKFHTPALVVVDNETTLGLSLRGDKPALTHPDLASFYDATPEGRVELNIDLVRHFPRGASVEIVRRDA